MMISTRGRYALHIMIDLAQHSGQGPVSLKAIAGRQGISLKYLEAIIALLNKNDLVNSTRGKEGGYTLARNPGEITVSQVINAAEGSIAPVACVGESDSPCENADCCLTLPLWQNLDRLINDYLAAITILDLAEGKIPPPNV